MGQRVRHNLSLILFLNNLFSFTSLPKIRGLGIWCSGTKGRDNVSDDNDPYAFLGSLSYP